MDGKFISLIDETNLINQIRIFTSSIINTILFYYFCYYNNIIDSKTFEPLNAVITKIPEIIQREFLIIIHEVTGNGEIKVN